MKAQSRPVPMPVRPEAIPAELRSAPQWVVWRYSQEIDNETGEIDYDKPPLCARGGAASSTNPRTWSTFAGATTTYQKGGLDGIGFVLAPKKDEGGAALVAVDLDHCRNAQTGEIEPWAMAIIGQLNSYTEASPSGTGIRIFAFGKLPPHGRKRGNFECYCTARYVTVTGHRIAGTPATIETREAELLEIHQQIWPELHAPQARSNGHASMAAADLTDLDLIEKAKKAKNGARFSALWGGDTSGYNSASEADLALVGYLAFWCGPSSSDRIDALFRQSGLFRSKWNREDYRTRTIHKAMEGRSEFYSPRRRPSANGKPPAPPSCSAAAAQVDPHLTDLGNAKRVVARHGADLHYCHDWKQFLVWDGRRWVTDNTGEAVRRAKETQAWLFRSVSEQMTALRSEGDGDEKKSQAAHLIKVLQHSLKWEDARRIAATLDLMRSEPTIPILPGDMDRDLFALNVLNGTIDLRSGELRPHLREDHLTKLAPVTYDASAACPLWQSCLATWMSGKQQLASYLQRVIGYSLSGNVSEQVLFFFYGLGSNGKSTFIKTILEMLGDYGIQAVSELLMAKNSESHPTERADLFGRRLVATIETDEGKRMAEAFMKQLTGGEKLRARRMRENFWELEPTWKIILAANHKPVIRGTDFAVWRRIRLVPFTVTIREVDKDKDLAAKLRSERPGILNWALRGFRDWQSRGLDDPDEVREATADYQREQDTLANFLADCCTLADFAKVKSSALLKAFQEWSGDRSITAQALRKKMNGKGLFSQETKQGWFYQGVGLTPSESDFETGWV